MREAADALEMVGPAVQGEPVGWQFYQDGEWWYGDDRIKLHRKNTEAAGIPVRDVYAVPQPPAHWSHDNPGLADQYRAEALAARRSLCFEQDANDVAPTDIVAAIESLTRTAPDTAQAEVQRLCEWIKDAGDQYDICTYNILGKICDGCRCKRAGGES